MKGKSNERNALDARLFAQIFCPVRLALPFLSTRPFRCVRPFVAALSFHSLLPSFRFNSLLSRSLLLPFRFNSFLLFPIRRSFRFKLFSSVCYFPPILSTRPPCSFTSSFHFKAFISLRYFLIFLPFVSIPFVYLFVSFQVVHFVTSFLSLQLFFPARLALRFLPTRPFHCIRPFVATLPFHSLLPSFRFNSFSSRSLLLPFRFNSALLFPIRRFFCFKLFSSVRYFLPIVLMLPSSSCTASFHFKAFISLLPYLLPSFLLLHAVRLPLPFVSCRSYRYLLRFASALLSCPSCFSFPFNSSISLHPSFRCNLSLPFVTSFLSFQTSLPFVCLFLSFQVVHFIIYIFPFLLTRTSRVTVAACGCLFEFQLPRVLQQCNIF